MDWDDFLAWRAEVIQDAPRGMLMCGPAGDNNLRGLNLDGFVELNNTEAALFPSGIQRFDDFVWTGRKVRIPHDFASGGHPALAGYDEILCAGCIAGDHFFFHSGHYQPTVRHAVHFMCDFVYNSCEKIVDPAEREKRLKKLASMALRLYRKNMRWEVYSTDLLTLYRQSATAAQRVRGRELSKHSESSNPIGRSSSPGTGSWRMPASAPMAIGGRGQPRATQPMVSVTATTTSIGGSADTSVSLTLPPPSAIMVQQELGVTPTALLLQASPIAGRARWVPDSQASRCWVCRASFNMLRWKHHCRRCGNIVCDDCSSARRNVALPAYPPGGSAETGAVRVCTNCQ